MNTPTRQEANRWFDSQPQDVQDRIRHEWEHRAAQCVTGRLGYRVYSDIQHDAISEAMQRGAFKLAVQDPVADKARRMGATGAGGEPDVIAINDSASRNI